MKPNSRNILIIGLVWPEPSSSAAGRRMMQLISIFKSWNYNITFVSTALENDLNFDLTLIDVEKQKIQLNSDSFDELLRHCNPMLVLFDRFVTEEQFGWRVSNICPNALKVLDSEDLHCLRHTRQSNFKNNIRFEIENLFDQEITMREIASILRCDLTLIIAEFELEILTKYFKIDASILHYLPILFSEMEMKDRYLNPNFSHRKDFMFIGNFWHEPNWDAVLYLKKSIWPEIKKQLPQAIIRIYGAYPSQKVFDLQNKKEGFLVLGRAEEAQKVISDARVLIAPLRFGGGIKGKLIEAMQFGTPSVTTSIGAESINGAMKWNGFVSDDLYETANKAVKLYEDQTLWNNAQENGYEILRKRFQLADFEQDFKNKIACLNANLTQHRKSNFLGSLLRHHSMKSTEYMSRWIQEKNKRI